MPLDITRTHLPSQIIASDLDWDQFFSAEMRTGSILGKHWIDVLNQAADDVIQLDMKTQEVDQRFGPRHAIKIRHIWINDKSGSFTIKLDYLHDNDVAPIYTEANIESLLNSGGVKYEGQSHYVEVRIEKAPFSSDYFSMLGDEFYQRER